MSIISAPGEIMNKMRVVSLACGTPTGPPFQPYQIHVLSIYLKQYGRYGLHKISASEEITTQ